MKSLFPIPALAILAISCTKNNKIAEKNTTVRHYIISADTRKCMAGVLEKECLMVKYSNKQTDWVNFSEPIAGFKYEKGTEYLIVVKEEKVENPPVDASNIKYTLMKIVTQSKITAKSNDVEDKKWELIELNGKPVKGNPETHYLILHSKRKTIQAKASCNTLFYSYELIDDVRLTINTQNGVSTLMACPDNLETEFKTALTFVDNVTTNGTNLSLNKGKMAPLALFKLAE